MWRRTTTRAPGRGARAMSSPRAFLLHLLAALVLLAAAASCGHENPATPAASGPAGSVLTMSDCKLLDAEMSARTGRQDCLAWSYDGQRTLTLQHLNTAFNCCPEYDVTFSVRQHALEISEREITGSCGCLCLFDLTYEVTDLPPGTYTVTIEQEYLQPGEPTHAHALQLTEATSGTACLTRTGDPWNLD